MRPRPFTATCRARAGCGLLALVLGGVALADAPAAAEHPAVPATVPSPLVLAPPSPELPGLPQTSIELVRVPVDSPAFASAADRYRAVDASHAEARGRRTELDHTLTVLRGRAAELEAAQVSARARIDGLSARLDDLDGAIQELAVEAFVTGDDDERITTAIASETPAISEADRRALYSGWSMEVLLAERTAYRARIDEAAERARTAAEELDAARAALIGLRADRPAAVDGEVTTAGAVATERVAYEDARVLATVDGVEFPLVALDAYYRAAAAASAERSGCDVRWWGLAGISRVEGRHGTYSGTRLQPNGDTSRRIIGIQLDGTRATAIVGDSDGGSLDGDATFDRAVGPMQFIPQTWSRFSADGNDDGVSSPFNLYDATLAAARYLCTASGGLDDDAGLRTAYFSYNHSLPYVDAVLGYARGYERKVEVPDPRR